MLSVKVGEQVITAETSYKLLQQLEQSIPNFELIRETKKRGRPKKYDSDEERKLAIREYQRKYAKTHYIPKKSNIHLS